MNDLIRAVQRLLLTYVAWILIIPPIKGEESKDLAAKISDILDASSIHGLSAAVIKNRNEVDLIAEGHTDFAGQSPVSEHTRFRAGSVSKLLTSILILRAQEAGKLTLHDAVVNVLPEAFFPRERAQKLRLEHLLEHTSGLEGSSYAEYASQQADLSPGDYVRTRQPFYLRWAPGDHYSYANSGHTIAAYVVEKAWGDDFDTLMKREVFKPLGMTESHFSTSKNELELPSYDESGTTKESTWKMPVRPSGSLVTTPADLAKLVIMLLGKGELPDGTQFLQPSSIERLHRAETSWAARHGAQEGSYALGNFGFVANAELFRGHWGRTEGFQTTVGYKPDAGTGFVIMVNTADRAGMHQLRETLATHLTETAASTDRHTPVTKPAPFQPDGIYIGSSHDMPLRAWLMGLVEARRIKATPEGLSVASAFSMGSPSVWTQVAPNLYQAPDIPVATGTLTTINQEQFWIDGESYLRASLSFYLQVIVLALGLVTALLVSVINLVRLGYGAICYVCSKVTSVWDSFMVLGLAGVSYFLMFYVFMQYGLLSGLSGAANLGQISFVSVALVFLSVIAPLSLAGSYFVLAWNNHWRWATLCWSVPLLALGILFALHGWLPLVTWRG